MVPIDSGWTLVVDREKYEWGQAWAELRVKKDSRLGDEYIDVLLGVKGSDPHSHYGINRDLSIRFHEHRGRIHTIRREVVDSNLGKTDDRTLTLKSSPGRFTFRIRIYAVESTRTVHVALGESGFISGK